MMTSVERRDKLMEDYQCNCCAGIIERGGELPENE
jgi:hypothetical protein